MICLKKTKTFAKEIFTCRLVVLIKLLNKTKQNQSPLILLFVQLQHTPIKFSVSACSDSGPGRPAADRGGQRRSAGGLEGRRRRGGSGLLAHLGGAAAEHHRWPALLLLHAGRLPLDAADQHPSLGQSVRVAHLQDSAWRRTLLHGAVSHRWDRGGGAWAERC